MAGCEGEQGHDGATREDPHDEPSLRLAVGLELGGKRRVRQVLELATPDELSESSPSGAFQIARPRAAQCLIDRRVAHRERIHERAPDSDGPCHQEERANQPEQGER